ncbi:hypothetical protein ATK17_0014 [Branchiibius hedensis]|uniref:Helix-turn-helix n=1 Tax=Branchiibius hedensis TaxID=672460 RepID=A0A2Y8ZK34_9MICO|nr:helix-turn-helix transcriptional regulator [Branchiibius hedensis]PWJ22816.1 hypothetical protein ATK17_3986 [Branchiibius hedensis]PWJ23933.1 hypothetical protein ATK17_0014 [Branchiibius hedensis]SSA32751.1 hypothetical protein SAMN04489750_0014 [Branchiibius hedensis]SSA59165.1 hypothetical protein SAMN04489750_3986 [Branchiibius hedensis]
MSWWEYVEQVAKTSRQRDISDRSGIDAANVSRWKGGHIPKAEMVAEFARAYGRPVLEAFVAAGFLTPMEAKERPAAAPSLGSLTDEELLDEIRKRMRRDGTATNPAGGSPAPVPDDGKRPLTDDELAARRKRDNDAAARAAQKAARHGERDPGDEDD